MKKILFLALATLISFAGFSQNLKFAYVNYTELVQLMPEADAARAKIQAATKEAQDTHQSMMQELQNKYQQYQAKSATWTPAVRESKEKELQDIQTRIQEFSQSIQQELQQQELKLMTPIQQKAMDVVNKLAKEGGYACVFDKASVLYISTSQLKDLTPDARKALKIKEGRTLESLQAEIQAKLKDAK